MSTLEKVDQSRPMSKYAKKIAERQAGTRPPFEFIEKDKSFLSNQVSLPLSSKASLANSLEIRNGSILIARITEWHKGYLLLRTKEDIKIFMSVKTLQGTPFDNQLIVGSILECKVESQPNGKGPRVRKILSILPKP